MKDTSDTKEEPQAFPFQAKDPNGDPNAPIYGMTLRDYFAAKYLQGISGDREMWSCACQDSRTPNPVEGIAIQCYDMADEMIRARNIKPSVKK